VLHLLAFWQVDARSVVTDDSFGDWATLLGALATLGLLIAAVWAGWKAARGVSEQIKEQRRIQRRARVFDLQSRFSASDFIAMNAEAVAMMEAFAADPSTAAMRWERMSNVRTLRVLAVLNFYELVATEYNSGVLERDVADPNLAYTVVATWDAAEAFLTYLRRTDPAYFAEWKYLYDHSRDRITASASQNDEDRVGRSPAGGPETSLASPAPPAGEEIHLPGPSVLPLLAAVGITLIVVGTTISLALSIVGVVLLGVVANKWIRSTRTDIGNLPADIGERTHWP
jgi:hypothetical protein